MPTQNDNARPPRRRRVTDQFTPSSQSEIRALVADDLRFRVGGRRLHTTGDSLHDAYLSALDLVISLRQELRDSGVDADWPPIRPPVLKPPVTPNIEPVQTLTCPWRCPRCEMGIVADTKEQARHIHADERPGCGGAVTDNPLGPPRRFAAMVGGKYSVIVDGLEADCRGTAKELASAAAMRQVPGLLSIDDVTVSEVREGKGVRRG